MRQRKSNKGERRVRDERGHLLHPSPHAAQLASYPRTSPCYHLAAGELWSFFILQSMDQDAGTRCSHRMLIPTSRPLHWPGPLPIPALTPSQACANSPPSLGLKRPALTTATTKRASLVGSLAPGLRLPWDGKWQGGLIPDLRIWHEERLLNEDADGPVGQRANTFTDLPLEHSGTVMAHCSFDLPGSAPGGQAEGRESKEVVLDKEFNFWRGYKFAAISAHAGKLPVGDEMNLSAFEDPAANIPKMGFYHDGQADLELLTSGDSPTSASQSARITGMSHRARYYAFSWDSARYSDVGQEAGQAGPLEMNSGVGNFRGH
ncbi:Protein GVQW1, partial [Plecturocebus cupreus]